MKKYSADDDAVSVAGVGPSTSYDIPKTHLTAPTPAGIVPQFQSLSQTLNHTLNQTLNHSIQLNPNLAQNFQQTLNQSLATSLAAGLSTGNVCGVCFPVLHSNSYCSVIGLSPMNLGLVHNGLSPSSPMLAPHLQQKPSPLQNDLSAYRAGSASACSEFEGSFLF